ncbi:MULTISPECIES: flavodoxin family protein [Anaerovoracaceae]
MNMKILVLNGSPRANGNTAAIAEAFSKGAKEAGHQVEVLSVGQQKIVGCMGCEYCHTKGDGTCIQKDAMQDVYRELADAEMLVLASPIYYFTLSGQLQCCIHRTYAVGIPKKLKKAAMLLSSGSDGVYGPAKQQYRQALINYMGLKDMGVITAYGSQNKSAEKLQQVYEFGKGIDR